MSSLFILGATLLLVCTVPASASDNCTPQNGECVSKDSGCDFPKQPVKHLCPDDKICCLKDEDIGCTKQGGICQEITEKCGRSYVRFLCGGGNNRRCCLPNAAAPCTAKGGKCLSQWDKCYGKKVYGLCGDKSRKCCIPRKCKHKGSRCGSDTCCKIPGFYYLPHW
ncbi:helofensin-1-like [Saccostrea echinata]|uniref:helofensin-1-like n=1 Tax=Saccostrea echinata TaxID=191078 RepID=UPI002A7F5604|nr:helofensin-1-like [Saccostrea echinata]